MAGLCVLLETHKSYPRKPQIICKTTLIRPSLLSRSSSSNSPSPAPTSPFLQRCFLCHKELSEDNDIYMYRGDRAFCSVECRCRQIFIDEDIGKRENCAKHAAECRRSRASTGKGRAFAGGFAY